MARLTIEEASKRMNASAQFVRRGIETGKLPFGVAVKFKGSSRHTYWIDEEKLEKWLDGRLSQ